MSIHDALAVYLLSIRGTLAPATLDAARKIHNETAGAPPSVAAARSLGDMSHMVYVPIDHSGPASGEFLILDQWISMEGLGQFFANKQVQEQAGQIFTQRDPVVWARAEGYYSYNFPVPYGKNERIVALLRGMVPSRAATQKLRNAIVDKQLKKARAAGNVSHEAYFRVPDPGANSETLEFFAVDVWADGEGMNKYYADPEFLSSFEGFFTAEASTSIWVHPTGQWIEW